MPAQSGWSCSLADAVPAHVRNLVAPLACARGYVVAEVLHPAVIQCHASGAFVFLAVLHEHLHSHADPQERFLPGRLPHGIEQVQCMQGAHAVKCRTLAREYHLVTGGDFFWIRCDPYAVCRPRNMLDRLYNRIKVSYSVINYGKAVHGSDGWYTGLLAGTGNGFRGCPWSTGSLLACGGRL